MVLSIYQWEEMAEGPGVSLCSVHEWRSCTNHLLIIWLAKKDTFCIEFSRVVFFFWGGVGGGEGTPLS